MLQFSTQILFLKHSLQFIVDSLLYCILPLTVVAKYTHPAQKLPAAIRIFVAAIRFAMVIGVYVVTPSCEP